MLGQMIAQMMMGRGGMSGGQQMPQFGVMQQPQPSAMMAGQGLGQQQGGLAWGAQGGGGLAQLLAMLMQNRGGVNQTMPQMQQPMEKQPMGGSVDPRVMQPSLWRHMGGMRGF